MSSKMKFWAMIAGAVVLGAAYASKIRSVPVIGKAIVYIPGADK